MPSKKKQTIKFNRRLVVLLVGAGILVWAAVGVAYMHKQAEVTRRKDNPLYGRKFYVDDSRQVTTLAATYRSQGYSHNADLLEKISSHPGTTWLVGPSAQDPEANKDIAEVVRTSEAAAKTGTVPVYELYAIPNRDACAGYSKAGFVTNDQYLHWVDRILGSLKTKAVFSVEADAVAQTVGKSCLSQEQIGQRYGLLKTALEKLHASPYVLASYLDAGHSEWAPDPSVLVEPLKKSGIDNARGVAVNVSFSVATSDITKWSQQLVEKLGGNYGVIIDTSRNGQGTPPDSVKGENRWCNAEGRGLGPAPSSTVNADHIDAHLWIKNIGESDGGCRGHKPAGVFEPEVAIDLAKNAKN